MTSTPEPYGLAKFCPECGNPRASAESKFCGNCGHTLALSEQSTPTTANAAELADSAFTTFDPSLTEEELYVARVNAYLSGEQLDAPSLFGMFVKALTTPPFPEDVWGADTVVGKRVVAHFEASDLMVTATYTGELTIARPQGEGLKFELPDTFPAVKMENRHKWLWSADLKAWLSQMKIADEEVVRQMQEVYGTPVILLPWSRLVEDTENSLEVDEDAGEAAEVTKLLLSAFDEYSDQAQPTSSVEVKLIDNDEFMPPQCGFSRFMQMVSELQERGWFIMWDECCGTCAGSTRRSALESGEITEDTPEFILWSQNAEGVFGPEGAVYDYTTYYSEFSDEDFATLQEVAEEYEIDLSYEEDASSPGTYTIQYSS